ncbi:MAG TPA: hypothetical protein DCM62_08800 [Bacteroidales bacterium]|nr:hypothetical protein [Bacteroidales bacterium]
MQCTFNQSPTGVNCQGCEKNEIIFKYTFAINAKALQFASYEWMLQSMIHEYPCKSDANSKATSH